MMQTLLWTYFVPEAVVVCLGRSGAYAWNTGCEAGIHPEWENFLAAFLL